MIDYKSYSDEELICMYRDGDNDVPDFLMEKYKNLVRKMAGSMFILGADKEDLIQEGMIGLFKAIRDYDSGRDASFMTFADLCISRQMYTAVTNSQRKKHSPLNAYVSFYENYANEDMGEVSPQVALVNILRADDESNPENVVLNRENAEYIVKIADEVLSPLEKSVFELHMIGMSYVEIAKILGRDAKSTDNALNRMKTKLRKRLISDGKQL